MRAGRRSYYKGDTSEVIIDEIKGILRDLSLIEQPVNVHLAQAKCYAYIYAKQHSLREIGIQMTYCNLDTEEIRRFYHTIRMKHWNAGLKN